MGCRATLVTTGVGYGGHQPTPQEPPYSSAVIGRSSGTKQSMYGNGPGLGVNMGCRAALATTGVGYGGHQPTPQEPPHSSAVIARSTGTKQSMYGSGPGFGVNMGCRATLVTTGVGSGGHQPTPQEPPYSSAVIARSAGTKQSMYGSGPGLGVNMGCRAALATTGIGDFCRACVPEGVTSNKFVRGSGEFLSAEAPDLGRMGQLAVFG